MATLVIDNGEEIEVKLIVTLILSEIWSKKVSLYRVDEPTLAGLNSQLSNISQRSANKTH